MIAKKVLKGLNASRDVWGANEVNDDKRTIRELVNTWFAASKSGDLSTVLDLMTEDVIFMVPGQWPFGKETFASAFKGMKDTHAIAISFSPTPRNPPTPITAA
jgi:ketosteroid isomerase-like protein